MFGRIISYLAILIGCTMPGLVSADLSDYYIQHTVTALDSTTCTLDDGSVWELISQANPLLVKDTTVWIVPIMQETVYAVFFSLIYDPTTLLLSKGSTTLTITSIENGIVTLSDTTQWTLDPYYSKYTSGWKKGDPITLAGRHNEYFLINGSFPNGPDLRYPTYSLVSSVSTVENPA